MRWDTRTTWATRCGVQWVKMTTQDWTKLTRRLRAHSLVRCRVSCALCWSWLSGRHWCRTSCRSVHHAYVIQVFFLVWKSDFILSSSMQTVAIIIACCTSRKRVIWGVVFTRCSRRGWRESVHHLLFTLSKNDLHPNDKSNSVSSFPMMNCCGLPPLWGSTSGVPVLSWFSFSSTIMCLVFSRKKLNWNSCPCTRGDNGFLRSVIHQFISFPLLRRPSFLFVSPWEACWVRAFNKLFVVVPWRVTCHGRHRVAPFCHISQLSHSRDSDFHSISSPGFPMQERIDLREPLQSDSSLVSTLLWLFLHLIPVAIFSTSLQNKLYNWNG